MALARLLLYFGGLVVATGLAVWFLRLRGSMAKYLAASYAVWALACTTFLLNLFQQVVTNYAPLPEWGRWMFTINALLMFLAPAALAVWIFRDTSNGHA